MTKPLPRVVVFGYGEFGRQAISSTVGLPIDVVSVVIPSNRKNSSVDIVRERAATAGIPVLEQPTRNRIKPFLNQLKGLNADLFVVWSYTMILPKPVITIPRVACVNLHSGKLPDYRGGHVLQWAIANGESETAITMHHIDEGIDTGDVIDKQTISISPSDDANTLSRAFMAAGDDLIRWRLLDVANGAAPRISQDESKANYYRLRTVDDGKIDWYADSKSICNLVRALVQLRPGAFADIEGRRVSILKTEPRGRTSSSQPTSIPPGTIITQNNVGVVVATGNGSVLVKSIETDGKRYLPSQFSTLGIRPGARFTTGVKLRKAV